MNFKQLMVRDGAPAALFLTPAQRAKAWQGVTLRSIPLFQAAPKDESPETKAFRAQEEERRRLKSLEGIARMKLRMASKAIDFNKVRWDARRNKFVPLEDGTTEFAPTVKVLSSGSAAGARDETTPVGANIPTRQQLAIQQTMNKIHADRRAATAVKIAKRQLGADPIWSRVNKDTARDLAQLNGVWDDKYAKLSGGLLVMTVTNRLKGLVKKGGEVKWQ